MSIVIPDTLDALLVPIDAVRPDPSNVMQHPPSQIDALAASLVAFGFDQPILARRNGLIIAGHGRLLAARQVGMTHVPVVYTDLDGVDAARRMIGDNRLAALAEPDAGALAELLRQLQAEDALGGTGYDEAAVEALLKEVAGAMPTGGDAGPNLDPGEGRYREQYGVIVMCADEAEQEEIYNALLEQGYTCKVVVT
jgi:ParB-like chromosome segregation protein Spo0J